MRAASGLLLALAATVVLGGCGGGMPSIETGSPLEDAYATLHAAGFRVAVRAAPHGYLGASSLEGLDVVSVLPRAGTPARAAIRPGDVVTLVGEAGDIASMVGGPYPPDPVRMADLVGRTPEAAIQWAGDHEVNWILPRLPNLPPSNGPTFLGAYRVVAQSPAAGSMISGSRFLRLKVEPRR